MLKIVRHRVDDVSELVLPEDSCWDMDKIEKEKTDMVERGEDPDDHPVSQYFRGEDRYCLRNVREYFKPDTKPTIFKIKRPISNDAYAEIMELARLGKINKACLIAFEKGIEDVLNLDGAELDAPNMPYKHLSKRDVDLFMECEGTETIGREIYNIVGNAVISANDKELKKKKIKQ